MHPRAASLLVAVCLFGVPSWAAGQAPADLEKGAALLSQAREAVGGAEALAGVARLQARGTFRRAAGGNTVEGDVEIFIEPPDKYRRDEDSSVAGGPTAERTEVLNGTEVWDETKGGAPGGFGGRGFGRGRSGGRGGDAGRDGQPAPAIDPARIAEAQRRTRQADLSRLLLAWLLKTDDPVAWIGTARAPDGTADVVEIRPAEGPPMRLFLETSTHVPLMITWETAGGRGFGARGGRRGRGRGAETSADAPAGPPQPVTFEMHLSDYKTVNGIKLPHLITRGVGGQTQEELEIKNFRVNPSFKANTFSK